MNKYAMMMASIVALASFAGTAAADAPATRDPVRPAPIDDGGTKCRALEPGDRKLILEVEERSFIRCSSLLMTELRKHWCSAANKGRKFPYVIEFDHTLGTGRHATRMKERRTSLTCFTVAK